MRDVGKGMFQSTNPGSDGHKNIDVRLRLTASCIVGLPGHHWRPNFSQCIAKGCNPLPIRKLIKNNPVISQGENLFLTAPFFCNRHFFWCTPNSLVVTLLHPGVSILQISAPHRNNKLRRSHSYYCCWNYRKSERVRNVSFCSDSRRFSTRAARAAQTCQYKKLPSRCRKGSEWYPCE